MVSERMLALGTEPMLIRELHEYALRRAAQVGEERVFDFSLGNPAVPPPPEVDETAAALLRRGGEIHAYTSAPGDPAARQALAADIKKRFGADCPPESLYLTAGAAGALSCVFHALACPGDVFVVLAPYFPEYRVYIESAGAAVRAVPVREEDFQLDLRAIGAALGPEVKGLVLNAPNNPTGVVYSRESLRALSALLTERAGAYGHPIYLISDEPYREIAFPGVEVPWVPALYRDTIVCYSFSKSLSLPGERQGYVLVPPEVTDAAAVMGAVAGAGRALGYVNAPSLFQQVTARCCGLTADISLYARNCRVMARALREMGYRVVEPQGAFYLFPQAPERDDLAFCRRAQALDVLVVPGRDFGMPGYFRVACCVPAERVDGALPRFRELMAQYRANTPPQGNL